MEVQFRNLDFEKLEKLNVLKARKLKADSLPDGVRKRYAAEYLGICQEIGSLEMELNLYGQIEEFYHWLETRVSPEALDLPEFDILGIYNYEEKLHKAYSKRDINQFNIALKAVREAYLELQRIYLNNQQTRLER